MVIGVLQYLRDNPSYGFRYEKKALTRQQSRALVSRAIRGAVDTNFVIDSETSRSVIGWVFSCLETSISWCSKKQPQVTTGTCHAEYVAASQETVFWRELLKDVSMEMTTSMEIDEDNEAAIFLSENPALQEKSKHIRKRWHYVRQYVRDGTLKLKNVAGTKNAADALTKAVSPAQLVDFRRPVGLQSP